jgi:hypothetical protein
VGPSPLLRERHGRTTSPDEQGVSVSELASERMNTAAPRTRLTSVSEEDK